MKVLRQIAFASFLLSSAALTDAALAGDNCQNVKDGVTQQWGASAWGPLLGCYSGTTALAEQDGSTACFELLAQGVLGHVEYREVHLWIGGPSTGTIPLGKTYLGYCAGNKPGLMLDKDKAKEQQRELDAKIKR